MPRSTAALNPVVKRGMRLGRARGLARGGPTAPRGFRDRTLVPFYRWPLTRLSRHRQTLGVYLPQGTLYRGPEGAWRSWAEGLSGYGCPHFREPRRFVLARRNQSHVRKAFVSRFKIGSRRRVVKQTADPRLTTD